LKFFANFPSWIRISDPINRNKILELENKLDLGEATSIALAYESPEATLCS